MTVFVPLQTHSRINSYQTPLFLSVPFHWWITEGKDDQKANETSPSRFAAFHLQRELCVQVFAPVCDRDSPTGCLR